MDKPSEKTQEFVKIISEYFDSFRSELNKLREDIKDTKHDDEQ